MIVLRLDFEMVFPGVKRLEPIEYLKKLSNHILIAFPGFSNIHPQLNYNNFFSKENSEFQKEIIKRVDSYNTSQKEEVGEIGLISREASLRLTELALANNLIDYSLIIGAGRMDIRYYPADEQNMFLAYLSINSILNERNPNVEEVDRVNKMTNLIICGTFPTFDFNPIGEARFRSIQRLTISTYIKLEYLLQYIKDKSTNNDIESHILNQFNQTQIVELKREIFGFIYNTLKVLKENGFKLEVKQGNSIKLFESLLLNEGKIKEDFSLIKQKPVYKVDKNVYSIIDPFFAIDKWYKGMKFVLIDYFKSVHGSNKGFQKFNEFYNKPFFEEYLVNGILDRIFDNPHLVKKKKLSNPQEEPDYYIRQNKSILLFEIKDIMIDAKIKASGDFQEINSVFMTKLVEEAGIKQLISQIEKILSFNYQFDDLMPNTKYSIYPIIIMSDRIFNSPGINYRLNQIFQENLFNKLGNNLDISLVKDLTILDIDTLIYHLKPLQAMSFGKIKTMLNKFHNQMTGNINGYGNSETKIISNIDYKLHRKLRSLSIRLSEELQGSKLNALTPPEK